MVSASFTPKETFQLMAIIDAIPTRSRHHLKTCNNYHKNSMCSNSAQLHLNGHNICLDKAISKNIYKEVRSKVEIIPTAQLNYSKKYNYQLDWKEMYRIPFRVTLGHANFSLRCYIGIWRRINFSIKSALYLFFYVHFAKEKANLLNTF